MGDTQVAVVDDPEDDVNELEAALKGPIDLDVTPDDDPKPDDKPDGGEPKPDDGDPVLDADGKPVKVDDDKPADPVDDDKPAPEETVEQRLERENAELRQATREMRRQMAIMSSKVDRLGRRPAPEVVTDDLDPDAPKPTPETIEGIEKLQHELDEVASSKGERLEEIVELMSLNPKFEDVREVCTRDRFDDIFEAAAASQTKSAGGDPLEAQIQLELSVWKMANPYRYMYDLIKKHHPDFAEPVTPAKDNKGVQGVKTTDDAKARGKQLPNAPGSAYDITGGGSKATGGWTAERIDELPEHDLHKVPDDIYQKYLRGELDT